MALPHSLSCVVCTPPLPQLPILPCLYLPWFNHAACWPLKIEARKHAPRTESAKVRNIRSIKLRTGTREKPRLLVFCSDKHLYVQLIDDTEKATLVSACTAQSNLGTVDGSLCPIVESAKRVGEEVAKECLKLGIKKVIYYRRGTLHWKRVVAFRHAVQEGGLEIEFPK